MSDTIDILVLSGEQSGDQLASQLLQDIKAQFPHKRIAGMGGPILQKQMDILVDNRNLSIIGVWEALKKIKLIWRAWGKLKQVVKRSNPLVILIDYPGMNLRFAKLAKKNNCKTLYYVSPQIWAWKAGRIHKIKRYVDHMAVLFPFEKAIYDKANVPCTVVGHPLAKKAEENSLDQASLKAKLGFTADKPLVVLCPGSRGSEISMHLPIIWQSVEALLQQQSDLQFALLRAPSIGKEKLGALPAAVKLLENSQLSDVFQAADAGIMVSGTITLEAAYHQLPMTVIYKMNAFNYPLAKLLVKTPYVALCNIVCQQELAKELLQQDANAQKISANTLALINAPDSRNKMATILTALPPADNGPLLPVIRDLVSLNTRT